MQRLLPNKIISICVLIACAGVAVGFSSIERMAQSVSLPAPGFLTGNKQLQTNSIFSQFSSVFLHTKNTQSARSLINLESVHGRRDLFLINKRPFYATSSSSLITTETFQATSPCAPWSKKFLQIPASDRCDLISWTIVISQNSSDPGKGRFKLSREHSYYIDNATEKSLGNLSIEGTWVMNKGMKDQPTAEVYTLYSTKNSIRFIRISDRLIHLLDENNSFAVGDGGQNYTFSKTGGVTSVSGKVSATAIRSIAKEKLSQMVFAGRTPCQEISKEANISNDASCFKMKWLITFFFDPNTGTPTGYKMERTGHRQAPIEGKWTIINNEIGTIYQLDPGKPDQTIRFLKADNVLFFLDKNLQPLVGNAKFSYTLNRDFKSRK